MSKEEEQGQQAAPERPRRSAPTRSGKGLNLLLLDMAERGIVPEEHVNAYFNQPSEDEHKEEE